ncbi:MAG TPA: thermonuclease family protein [Lacipirellulaceae bacterium]|nr:thermonuclease family protein [Lacipirellulaceae bacterium]
MKRFPRPYWREPRGIALGGACALLIVWRVVALNSAPSGPDFLAEGMHEVRRVVDGDTLLLASGARVRLQGIDTPETVREGFDVETWGPQASQFTKQFVDRAENRVRLTFSLERKDHYDRFLAFVWDGDVMLNEELVRAGLAHARLDYRYSGPMKTRLARAQDEARRAGRGLWSSVAATQE